MHFAVFVDEVLKRKCIITKENLTSDALYEFEAQAWYDALQKSEMDAQNKIPAFICLPICSSYLTYIDEIDLSILLPDGFESISSDDYRGLTLIYDTYGLDRRKMLNRELQTRGRLCDIVAGNLIVAPEDSRKCFEAAYENFGRGQAFIFDSKNNDIKTIKCSAQALAVLRKNNISIIA